jgi:hypothetical protein
MDTETSSSFSVAPIPWWESDWFKEWLRLAKEKLPYPS